MATYVQQNQSRRMAVFGLIVGFHVLLGYGLVSGLARKVVEVVAPPLVTDIIEEIKPEDKPPPPRRRRRWSVRRCRCLPPDVVIDIPVEYQHHRHQQRHRQAGTRRLRRRRRWSSARTPAKIGRMPSSEDYYPAASKRAEEQGTVAVEALHG
jgi:protein TonB